jgi:hypothetical protein
MSRGSPVSTMRDVRPSSGRFVSVFVLAVACAIAPAPAFTNASIERARTSSVFTVADVTSDIIGIETASSHASAHIRLAETTAFSHSPQPAVSPSSLALRERGRFGALDARCSARISSRPVASLFVRGPPRGDFAVES